LTCEHCVAFIKNAITNHKKDIKVEVNLTSKQVKVSGDIGTLSDIIDVIHAAGYTVNSYKVLS